MCFYDSHNQTPTRRFMKVIDRECCGFGEYKCDVKVNDFYVDACVADIVGALNKAGIETKASCCGHQKIRGSVILADGRELFIVPFKERK